MPDSLGPFRVDRGTDGINWPEQDWKVIQPVAGQTSYGVTDTAPHQPDSYYRIRETTANGTMVPYNKLWASTQPPGTLLSLHLIKLSSSGDARVTGIAYDHGQNTIAVGYFRGTVDLGDGVSRSSTSGNLVYDIFVVKFKADKTVAWAHTFGGSSDDYAYGVAVDSADNIILTGGVGSAVDFGNGPVPYSGGQDIVVVKFSSAGDCVWSKTYGSGVNENGFAVAVDAGDNIFLGGIVSYVPVDMGGAATTMQDFIVPGAGSTVQVSVNTTSNWPLIGRIIAISDISGFFSIVSVDSSTQLTLRNSNATVNNTVLSGSRLSIGGVGGFDAFLLKLTSGGSPVWNRRIGGSGDDRALSVAADRQGNMIATGNFAGTVDFGGVSRTATGSSDMFLAKYSSSGILAWVITHGSSGQQTQSNGVATDPINDDVLVTGGFAGTVNFGGGDLTAGSAYAPGFGGGTAMFVARYDSSGNYVWAYSYGGYINSVDLGSALTVSPTGRIGVTGGIQSFWVNFGCGPIYGSNHPDFFTLFLTAAGQCVWNNRISSVYGLAVAFDSAANLIVAGYGGGSGVSIDFGGGPAYTGGGSSGGFVATYSH